MIYWTILLVWLIVATILIVTLKKDLKSNLIILVSQIYNFIIGLFGWTIYFIILIFILGIFKNMIDIYLCYILSGIIFLILLLILLIPMNIKIKRKTGINAIKYIILSIFIIILGMITFLYFSNLELL